MFYIQHVQKHKCENNPFGNPTVVERVNASWEDAELPEYRAHEIEIGYRRRYDNGSYYYKYLFGRVLLAI